jgi:DNA-binding transcriptional MerR regulator
MPETRDAVGTGTAYLSIGEVLGLLLEEFPDVTISKIRFLESQGLIEPERTPSGYRKFYEPDVDLLRVILREQRENYLPLRVIKDRIESGEIDPSGEVTAPKGIRNVAPGRAGRDSTTSETPLPSADDDTSLADVIEGGDDTDEHVTPQHVAGHPAARSSAATKPAMTTATTTTAPERAPTPPTLLPGVLLGRDELCAMAGITAAQLGELESYGVVAPRSGGRSGLFGDDDVEIASLAGKFLALGVDARHLRGWRVSAEREAGLFEQRIVPLLRQRNPQARQEALDQLHLLDELGGRMRSAMMRAALRRHFEG